MRAVTLATSGVLVWALLLLGCGTVPHPVPGRKVSVVVLRFAGFPDYIDPEEVIEVFISRLATYGQFSVTRGEATWPPYADLGVTGTISTERKVNKGLRIPFLFYLPRVSTLVRVELRVFKVQTGEVKLVRVISARNSWQAPLQLFAFDDKDPSLCPSAVEERRLWKRTVMDIADLMCRAILEVVPSR